MSKDVHADKNQAYGLSGAGDDRYLGGMDSDPRLLGWMQGFPPSPDKRITFERDQFLDFPQIRWTLSHLRELGATVNVRRGNKAASHFERYDRAHEINELKFDDLNGRTTRFEDALYDTYTDGIVVLHRGRIIYERYFGASEPSLAHALYSVTKVYVGTLASDLIYRGILNESKLVPHYVPELRGTAWEDATIRQVMDMQVGVGYTEDYADPTSGVRTYMLACGMRPRPAHSDVPTNFYDYLRALRKEGMHGDAFAYKTVNSDVIAWAMAKVTGFNLADYLHQQLWSRLGCEEDGYMLIDSVGTPMAGGGLSATLRDMARFGELIRREGDWHGSQLIPASIIDEIRRGDDPAKFAKTGSDLLRGYSYRAMWYVSHNELGAFEGKGMHGQRLYIAPEAEMVVARFASHPVGSSVGNDPISVPQFLALGRMLQE
ncbi:serine hydrolase [Mesorhizobium sp. M0847]|uniref:serine hydrolase domain-containing protein n=1 Tax=unclassified Mesorhizobium TaxID=325217 RepID=UPI003335F977